MLEMKFKTKKKPKNIDLCTVKLGNKERFDKE